MLFDSFRQLTATRFADAGRLLVFAFTVTLAALVLGPVLSPLQASAEPLASLAQPAVYPAALRQARPLGRLASAAKVNVAISLPWRNADDLAATIGRLTDPNDPLYKKFLTHDQFVARYAPTQADYDAVKSWAAASGLEITQTVPSRSLLLVSGTSATVEAAFHVHMNRFQLATGRIVYANDSTPQLPRSIAARVSSASGLTDYPQMRPHYKRSSAGENELHPMIFTPDAAPAGTGPGGGLTPADIRSVYNIAPLSAEGLDGTGQTVALYEQGGYTPSDITTYAQQYNLPTPNVQAIPILGFSGSPVADPGTQVEVTLDIEMILAVAPKAKILVYEFDGVNQGGAGVIPLLTKIANDNLASIVSFSYGQLEADASLGGLATQENQILQQMVTQGQCFYASSGDHGVDQNVGTDALPIYVQGVSDPASQPMAVGVGGTSFKTLPIVTAGTTSVATYGQETTWNFDNNPADGASGGGISTLWPIPSYQQAAAAAAAPAAAVSTTMRNVPDVALGADPNVGEYSIFLATQGPFSVGTTMGFDVVGGTSAASPLWAAFNALVNQQRNNFALKPLGFINPDLYNIAANSDYSTDFHDINDGSNNLLYKAEPGFDDATGLGSYNATNLLNDLCPSFFGSGTITVKAIDALGNPVPGVTVNLTSLQLPSLNTTGITGTDGTVTFTEPTGVHNFNNTKLDATLTYLVSGSLTGFTVSSQSGSVTPPATVTLKIGNPDHTYSSGGYQMISSPYDYSTVGNFAALFGLATPLGTNGDTSRLFAWSPSLNAYVGFPTAPADTLRRGQGYFAILPSNAYVRLAGVYPASLQTFRINLLAGWNMIGDPFLQPVSITTLGVDTINPSSSGPVAIGKSSSVQLPLYTLPLGATAYSTVTIGGALQPFQGYWIHATQPMALVLPVPAPQ